MANVHRRDRSISARMRTACCICSRQKVAQSGHRPVWPGMSAFRVKADVPDRARPRLLLTQRRHRSAWTSRAERSPWNSQALGWLCSSQHGWPQETSYENDRSLARWCSNCRDHSVETIWDHLIQSSDPSIPTITLLLPLDDPSRFRFMIRQTSKAGQGPREVGHCRTHQGSGRRPGASEASAEREDV